MNYIITTQDYHNEMCTYDFTRYDEAHEVYCYVKKHLKQIFKEVTLVRLEEDYDDSRSTQFQVMACDKAEGKPSFKEYEVINHAVS